MQKLDYKDAAIHNYLLSLYAQLQPNKLMVYLNFQGDVRTVVVFFLCCNLAHSMLTSMLESLWLVHDVMTCCSIVALTA